MDLLARAFAGACLCLTLFTLVVRAAPADPVAPDAERFYAAPLFAEPELSPDGKNVAFISPIDGRRKLLRLELSTGKIHGVFDPGEGDVRGLWWRGNDELLLTGGGKSGSAYFVQNIVNGRTREISELENTPAPWLLAPRDLPHHVLALGLNRFGYGSHLRRIDLATGRAEMVDAALGSYDHFAVAPNGDLIAKSTFTEKEWIVFRRPDGKSPWKTEKNTGPMADYWPIGVDATNGRILVMATDQGNTTAVMSLDAASGRRELVAQRPDRDVSRFLLERERTYRGVAFFRPGEMDEELFDPQERAIAALLAKSIPERVKRIASTSADGMLRIIAAYDDGCPPRYYLLDSRIRRLTSLGAYHTTASLPAIHTTRFITFTARDGTALSGSIVMPDAKRFRGPHAAVLIPLGSTGDIADEISDYSPLTQFLAYRGIATIHVFARGYGGFGRKFRAAGGNNPTELLLKDYEDGIRHLASANLVDPGRVGLIGSWSSALIGLHLATESNLFSAVVLQDIPLDPGNEYVLGVLSDGSRSAAQMAKDAGRDQSLSHLARTLRPGNNVRNLNCPSLVVWSYYHGASNNAVQLRRLFLSADKPHDWYIQSDDRSGPLGRSRPAAAFATRVATFLNEKLRVSSATPAAPAK